MWELLAAGIYLAGPFAAMTLYSVWCNRLVNRSTGTTFRERLEAEK